MIASASPLCPPPLPPLCVYLSHLLTLGSVPLILIPFALFPSVLLHFTPFFRSLLCCTCEIAGRAQGGGVTAAIWWLKLPRTFSRPKRGRVTGATSLMLFIPLPFRLPAAPSTKKVLFVYSEHFSTFLCRRRPRQDRGGCSCPVGRRDTEHLPVE